MLPGDVWHTAFGSPEITAEKNCWRWKITFSRSPPLTPSLIVRSGSEKFTDEEQRGFELFSTEYDPRRGQFGADCFHCHGGPLFQSQAFANNGSDGALLDIGREKVTGKTSDRGKFCRAVVCATSRSLRPICTMDRFRTLEDVVEHYSTGVPRSPTLDPNLAKHPDGGVPLSTADKRALVAFLKTLTDIQLLSPGAVRVSENKCAQDCWLNPRLRWLQVKWHHEK